MTGPTPKLSCLFNIIANLCLLRHLHHVSSFVLPSKFWNQPIQQRKRNQYKSIYSIATKSSINTNLNHSNSTNNISNDLENVPSSPKTTSTKCTWSPQDLTANNPGYPPIPKDDYIQQYQAHPELWPVEFFLITYRRRPNDCNDGYDGYDNSKKSITTEILVRKSANGTSKYGVGTGVPVTRWILSTESLQVAQLPPLGYEFSNPKITFRADNFPEFPKEYDGEVWSYRKIDIRGDAFHSDPAKNVWLHNTKDWSGSSDLSDPELEEYAKDIWECLKSHLSNKLTECQHNKSSTWETSTLSTVTKLADTPKTVAAIQGMLRMSGLFAPKPNHDDSKSPNSPTTRYINIRQVSNPQTLVNSMRIYTMFPQMPNPMPLPSTPPEELQLELISRGNKLKNMGMDPHKDPYGRVYTHISTNNVSNTIHGVYFVLDGTDIPGLKYEDQGENLKSPPPALDLFGTKTVEREWVSLVDLKVVGADGKTVGCEDTKPTFISGFIVRQLVKEGIIDMYGKAK